MNENEILRAVGFGLGIVSFACFIAVLATGHPGANTDTNIAFLWVSILTFIAASILTNR